MAVTYRLPQAGDALQNPAYRLADIWKWGVRRKPRRTPRHVWDRHPGACEARTRNLEIPGPREDACPGM